MRHDHDKKNRIRQKMLYLTAARLIHKSPPPQHVTLAELQQANPTTAEAAYSFMQWSDAKRFFSSGLGYNGGTVYYFARHLQGLSLGEIYFEIHKFFNPDHDGE